MLVVRNLTLMRNTKKLIDAFSYVFEAGKVSVVLGPNGAGKSTLLLALANMFAVEAGEVLVTDAQSGEHPVARLSRQQVSRLIAWQGELPLAEFGLTVEQRLLLAAGEGVDVSRFDTAVATMDVAALLNRDMAELSSGERQRVELAAMMQRNVPIWLLDEPTAHLDLRHQAAVLAMIRREADAGRLIVTVLHDLMQAISVADDGLLMDGDGGMQAGSASRMLTAARLSRLFGIRLKDCGSAAGKPALLPEFLGGDGEAA